MHTTSSQTARQNARQADCYSALVELERATKAQVRDKLRWTHMPEWEFEQLLASGMIVRLQGAIGQCVDAVYAPRRTAAHNGWTVAR